jgi:hypothetical protein
MMEENNINLINENKIIYKVPCSDDISEKVQKILDDGLIGEELNSYLENLNNKISGSELLNGILKKYDDPNTIKWFNSTEYGLGLKYLLENNITDQVICLILIQNYCQKHGLIKIQYKNSQIYLIKLLFQLLFTNDIIDETAFLKWQENLDEINIDEKTKNLLIIQTTEFFMIFKTIFNEDEENTNELEENNKLLNYQKNNIINDKDSDNEESENEEDDPFIVPEEQDYNLDDL